MSVDLYRQLVADARAVIEGRAQPPARSLAERARHEAGHVIVAWRCGLRVLNVTLRPTPRDVAEHRGGHTAHEPTTDPVLKGAVCWAGPIADRSLVHGRGDFETAAALGQHLYGPAFTRAHNILEAESAAVDRLAAALLDPASEQILFAEDVEGLLGPVSPTATVL